MRFSVIEQYATESYSRVAVMLCWIKYFMKYCYLINLKIFLEVNLKIPDKGLVDHKLRYSLFSLIIYYSTIVGCVLCIIPVFPGPI